MLEPAGDRVGRVGQDDRVRLTVLLAAATRLAPDHRRALHGGLAAAPLLVVAVAACSTHTTVTRQVTVPPIALPAGALQALVVQPAEAPVGAVPLLQASGPATGVKIASFAADPTTAQRELAARGFAAAYVVEYADTTAATSLEVTVIQFAAASGASAQLAADLAAVVPAGGSAPPVGTVGDASGAVVQPLPGGKGGQLATVRFRVGRLDYLVAATGPGTVDPTSVATIARTLALRAAASPLSH